MRVREIIEKEFSLLKAKLHLDPLEERTWRCEPLVVLDADENVVFEGDTQVNATPHVDGTADLIVVRARVGSNPSLANAKLSSFSSGNMYQGGSRDGLVCVGSDANGQHSVWYINGAAENYLVQQLKPARAISPKFEEPPD